MDAITKLIEMFKRDIQPTPQMLMQMDGMAQRNQERIESIKREMGEKWILHPAHKKSKLDEPRPV
jgi:hypothetical protein